MNGPQTRCKTGPRDRPRWGKERCTEQIEALDERKIQESVIGYSVNVPNIHTRRQGDPVSIPSTQAEDNPRLGFHASLYA